MTTDEFLRRQIIPLAYRQLPAAELFSRAAAGDAEAFVALVCLKYPLVEGVCRQAIGPSAPVEDVALEAFVQLWRQRERVRDAAAVDGWLTRTARNLAGRFVRGRIREREAGRAWCERSAATADPPDRAAIQAEIIRRVRLALSKQSDADQQLLWTAEHAGGDAQAAELLGLSVSTYRVRLHRARQRLRVLLKKYGVAPVVAATAVVGGWRNRAASAVSARWVTTAGRVQLVGLVVLCLTGLVGVAVWAAQLADHTSRPDPAPVAFVEVPASDSIPESLQQQNLRLLRTVIAPKVCAAMQPLALAGGQFTVAQTDAYDSRACCIIEIHNEKPLTGTGKVSRVAFYYDSYLRNSFVYFDPTGTGSWRWIDLNRPLVLFAMDNPRWELSVKIPGLEAAVKAFEELPKDPRGHAEAERRFIAMRDRARQYVGKWYRNGDPSAECRVELDETLSMRFYWPGNKGIYNQVLHPWRAEVGSRAKVKNEDGYLASYGMYLSADGQTLTFDDKEPPWHRTPRTK